MKAYFQKRILEFKKPAGTSRGFLSQKPSWYIYLYDEKQPYYKGIGEVSIIPGLSIDDTQLIEKKLSEVCHAINAGIYKFENILYDFPAINFGVETALLDFKSKGTKVLHSSNFAKGKTGIKTNGLIWIAQLDEMNEQVDKKIKAGFRCLKMKIGALDLEQEMLILRNIRRRFSAEQLEIRVDANGAFAYKDISDILLRLKDLAVHSIEQPILQGQHSEMATICKDPAIPIALDEELVGIHPFENKKKLIELIQPQYLILKPSLLGGIKESTDWIKIADELGVGWWVTSALESNIGLNAIAQWVATLETNMYQGLGLGNLYKENVTSPLVLKGEKLFYNPDLKWSYEFVS